ncbi:SRPBCC domain-containing protein [Labrys portucalensis]|uniref:SRPBCC domain-containing protein n=1 Tax=Labrys neptuniae TaxID=376174 RepID=A0ABV6ZKM6_9HYPH
MKPKFRVSARIAKPVREVFEAVVNPGKLSAYFTTVGGASAPLAAGATVVWWGKVPVEVDEVMADSHIVLRWDGPEPADGAARYKTRIEMNFEALEDDATLVTIAETGWSEDAQGQHASYLNCEGWSQMLCCLKAYLEYGINLREGYYRSELAGVPASEPSSDTP